MKFEEALEGGKLNDRRKLRAAGKREDLPRVSLWRKELRFPNL